MNRRPTLRQEIQLRAMGYQLVRRPTTAAEAMGRVFDELAEREHDERERRHLTDRNRPHEQPPTIRVDVRRSKRSAWTRFVDAIAAWLGYERRGTPRAAGTPTTGEKTGRVLPRG